MNLAERIVLFAARTAAFQSRRQGGLSREDHQQFRRLLRENPFSEDFGQSFRACLIGAIAMEAELDGICAFEWGDGQPVAIGDGRLIDLLEWIIENWQKIVEIIVFIIGLFI